LPLVPVTRRYQRRLARRGPRGTHVELRRNASMRKRRSSGSTTRTRSARQSRSSKRFPRAVLENKVHKYSSRPSRYRPTGRPRSPTTRFNESSSAWRGAQGCRSGLRELYARVGTTIRSLSRNAWCVPLSSTG
jgi:hypothetical protein